MFPKLQIMKDAGDMPTMEIGYRLSLDFAFQEKDTMHHFDHMVRQKLINFPPDVTINPCHRRSYGNASYDRIEAWDVTVMKADYQEAGKVAWDLWVR